MNLFSRREELNPLCDAHNHLQDERLEPRLPELLTQIPMANVAGCVVNGTSEKDWAAVLQLAEHDWIIPAFGVHPWFTRERSSNWFDTLRRYLDAVGDISQPGIGEIGLDRWMREYDLADQEKAFVAQLELAAERNLAVSIHCLKAWGHLEELLKAHRRPARGFLLHSYGGPAEMIPSFVKLGGYFSISGYFAHERKAARREVFKKVPLDRLLIETDAPDMLPPHELIAEDFGDLNDPRNLPKIYQFTADLLKLPVNDLAGRVATNFTSLFA